MIPRDALAIERDAEAWGGRHGHRAVAVLSLAACDHVVHEVMVVRVGGEREVRDDRAEMQHRRELNAQLPG